MFPMRNKIFLHIKIFAASWISFLLGGIFAYVIMQRYHLKWRDMFPGSTITWQGIILVGVLVVILGSRVFLAIRLIPLWKWLSRGDQAATTSGAPARVRMDALNLPAYYAIFIWMVWMVLAVFLAFLISTEALTFLTVLAGTGILAGFASAAFEYFLVEWIWRNNLPRFFRASDIISTPSVRIRLRSRLLILFILTTIPIIISMFLDLPRLHSVIIGFLGIVLAFILAGLSETAVAKPLEAIKPHLDAIQKGIFDKGTRVAVTSNDEIGELSARFNSMAESVHQRDIEVSTIYHISQEITESLDLNTTLQSILEEVRKIIPYDGAEITLYDKTDNLLHVGAWSSSAKVIVDTRGRTYKLGEGYTGWIGQNRQSLLIPDVDAHHGHKPTIRQIAEGVFLNGYLGVPLVVKGNKMVGTLNLVSSRKSVFDEHSQQILEIIAPQAAIAIDNAEQVIARERELKAQIERLKIEIDDAKRAQQVADITETSYFRNLKEQAQKLRQAARDDENGS